MSKSLGNFFTVREISEKYDLQVLRFFMLSAHYRSPLNFSDDLMESARAGLERITTCADKLEFLSDNSHNPKLTEDEKELLEQAGGFTKKFEEAMEDDFNTSDAIAAIFELVRFCNSNTSNASKAFVQGLYDQLSMLCDIMGITLKKEKEILDKEIEDYIARRQEARKAKDYALADQIRDELLSRGIQLKDTREGVLWTRV